MDDVLKWNSASFTFFVSGRSSTGELAAPLFRSVDYGNALQSAGHCVMDVIRLSLGVSDNDCG